MIRCVLCDSFYTRTQPAISCECGGEISRDVALGLPTKVLAEKRRRWLLFPDLVKRENARRKYFAAEVARAAEGVQR